ncbi:unnamed protein product [Ceutorhynchus assimilis]|uniref:G-protein coupled receptors family 1 profile domain-containing protein n=1 Tax=Ceutorhynchus assimilis TaxID=467358 RepID=A0A9N9MF39_9CUCU|nr:unnamed protein product [Ceutorhynchus assimilis]
MSNTSLNANGSSPFSPFQDPSESVFETETKIDFFSYFFITFELLKFLLCVNCFASDIYLIVIISKFKKLRTRLNNLFLIYAICNLLYLTLANVIMIIVEVSSHLHDVNHYCVISNLDHLMFTLSFYTLTFMAIDWYVLNYHPDIYTKYPRTFKYGIGVAFVVLAIPKWIATSCMCYEDRFKLYALRLYLEDISFAFGGIVLITISILKRIRTPVSDTHKTEYAFSIPKIIFLLSLPVFIMRLISLCLEGYYPLLKYLYLLEYITECLFLTQTIALLYLLGKRNKYFKMAYLKCCKKNVQEYGDDDLDSGSINETGENHVTYDNNSQLIRF